MKHLYHASARQRLEELRPRRRTTRDAADPPRVYAAPLKQIAAPFMAHGFEFGSWHDGPWTLVLDAEAREIFERTAGSIYTVSAEHFTYDPTAGLKSAEWFTDRPVEVLEEERWSSALEAALHYDLTVCVLKHNTLQEFSDLSMQLQSCLVGLAVPLGDGTRCISFGHASDLMSS